MARVTGDGQTRPSLTSHLRDIRQTGCDVMSILVSQEADVLLANLAYWHDNGTVLPCSGRIPYQANVDKRDQQQAIRVVAGTHK